LNRNNILAHCIAQCDRFFENSEFKHPPNLVGIEYVLRYWGVTFSGKSLVFDVIPKDFTNTKPSFEWVRKYPIIITKSMSKDVVSVQDKSRFSFKCILIPRYNYDKKRKLLQRNVDFRRLQLFTSA